MKKLLALLLALVMVCSFVACDDNSNKNDDGEKSNETTQSSTNDSAERFGLYLQDATLAKLDSLGKSEANKRIVTSYTAEYYYVSICIYTWSNPDAKYDTHEYYLFFNIDSGYDRWMEMAKTEELNIVEQNRDELWVKYIPDSDSFYETYNDVYNNAKSSTINNIIE